MLEPTTSIDYRALLDSMKQGMLLFNTEGRLVLDNLAARNILGSSLMPIRAAGWDAMARLLDGSRDAAPDTDTLRQQALQSPHPVRFHVYLAGAYTPCWMTGVYNSQGAIFTLLIIERPDWEPLTELMAFFRSEARMSVSATRGHVELIRQILNQHESSPEMAPMVQRIVGFTEIISTHMLRLQSLMGQLQRLEMIRAGVLPRQVREQRRKLYLADFLEDLLEEMADESMADPDMGGGDFRARLQVKFPDDLTLMASPEHLGHVLRDLLRNAACYSPPDAAIILQVQSNATSHQIQVDVIDSGYGIRDSERERVFAAFQRARQPQIIGVDGYGLSLYLCRHELEAMGGRIWFESQEGQGSTFSFRLPALANPR